MKFKISDLITTEYGIALVTKVWASKCVSALLFSGKDKGQYIYLRGLDFERSEVISETQ